MRLIDELEWRGLLNQVTHPELGDRLEQERFTFYCGFDPSADSLHIGNLVPIMGIMHFQRRGHKPIVLVGGGTGLIGDPSGKAEERKLQTLENIEKNLAGIRAQLEKMVSFEGDNAATMVNNADWLRELRLLEFLRDMGKHFSVNVMLAKESVRARLEDREHGISYTEFTYSLLQAYDFLHLHDNFGCRLQILQASRHNAFQSEPVQKMTVRFLPQKVQQPADGPKVEISGRTAAQGRFQQELNRILFALDLAGADRIENLDRSVASCLRRRSRHWSRNSPRCPRSASPTDGWPRKSPPWSTGKSNSQTR